MKSVFQSEIDSASHLVLVELSRQGRDNAQTGRGFGDDLGNASASLDLANDPSEDIDGASSQDEQATKFQNVCCTNPHTKPEPACFAGGCTQ
jgi:hypothetical protein